MEIIENSIACIDGAVAAAVAKGYAASDVASIGITNQRETTLVWSRVSVFFYIKKSFKTFKTLRSTHPPTCMYVRGSREENGR